MEKEEVIMENGKNKCKIAAWNCEGLFKKLTLISKELSSYDVIFLSETWHEMEINKLDNLDFQIISAKAKRESKFGRPSGGWVFLCKAHIKFEILMQNTHYIIIRVNTIGTRLLYPLVLAFCYIPPGKKNDELLDEIVECCQIVVQNNDMFILAGDMNAHTGNKVGLRALPSEVVHLNNDLLCWNRCSKDLIEDKRGKGLLDYCKEEGWLILNGSCRTDEKGIYIYLKK